MVKIVANAYKKFIQNTILLAILLILASCIIGLGAGTYASQFVLTKPLPTKPTFSAPILANSSTSIKSIVRRDAVIPPIVNGIAPLITHVATKQPVVFLTIDDGATKDPSFPTILKNNNLKASLFLADAFIRSDPEYFRQFINDGSVIENHTVSHDLALYRKDFEYQRHEICAMSDTLVDYYGRRPALFRPPGGSYTDNTLNAASACNMRATVHRTAKVDGGEVQYQEGNSLKPGDIVLMHFRQEFPQDIAAYLAATHAAGLQTQLLEDWL